MKAVERTRAKFSAWAIDCRAFVRLEESDDSMMGQFVGADGRARLDTATRQDWADSVNRSGVSGAVRPGRKQMQIMQLTVEYQPGWLIKFVLAELKTAERWPRRSPSANRPVQTSPPWAVNTNI